MTVFSSMTELINYYNEQETIPSHLAVTINGSVHTFKRTSTHDEDQISKGMIDNYSFIEDDQLGLEVELHINYYRHFEAKLIVEAYMLFFLNEDVLYLHPFYFYDRSLTSDDFSPYANATSDSLEKWTGLKWINTDEAPNAFVDVRANTYSDIQKDLFHSLPTFIETSPEERKKKWLIDDDGKSHLFNKTFEVPEYW